MTQVRHATITKPSTSGFTSNNNLIFLQRRGSSTTLTYVNAEHNFSVQVMQNQGVQVDVHIGDRAHRLATKPEAWRQDLATYLHREIGVLFVIAPETAAYSYIGRGSPVEADDVYLSPLRYEEYSDTIRHVPSNICVVAFKDGSFRSPLFDVDIAGVPYQQHVRTALEAYYPSDMEVGRDHCKRRLAWLAGVFLMQACQDHEIRVAVLARDMSTPAKHVFF